MSNPSQRQRIAELRKALRDGNAAQGNHSIEVTPQVVQHASYCLRCPKSVTCYLAGQTISVSEAVNNKYMCAQDKWITFRYHGATVLRFDLSKRTLDDRGYWGYSVSTSRAIGWYIHALVELDLIAPMKAASAIAFFRARKDKTPYKTDGLLVYAC